MAMGRFGSMEKEANAEETMRELEEEDEKNLETDSHHSSPEEEKMDILRCRVRSFVLFPSFIIFRVRRSKFALLLAEEGEGSSSPMVESDTTEDEKEPTNSEQRAEKRKVDRGNRPFTKRRVKKRRKKVSEKKAAENSELERLLEELDKKEEKTANKEESESTDDGINAQSGPLEKLLTIESRLLFDTGELGTTVHLQQGRAAGPPLQPFMGKIVQPKVIWPKPKNLGFQMISHGNDGGHVKFYRFWHKESYRHQQQEFWIHHRHADYQRILSSILNQQNAYHLDSILVMAHFWEAHGELERARDLIEHGIFACEFAAHPAFQPLSPNHRLEYACRENRAFFLLLHRHMITKIRTGRWKSALEFAKLLLAKEPDRDALGAILLIDALALRAHCPNFILDLYGHFKKEKRLDLLPNFRFSLVLALKMLGEEEEAEIFLEEALIRFPFVLSQILDFLQIKADPKVDNNYYLNTLAGYRETDEMRLMIAIYLHHSAEFWRPAETLNWLETATHRLLPKLQAKRTEMDQWAKKRRATFVGLPENVGRHCLLHGIPIPDTLLQDVKRTLVDDPVDPCPPKDGHEEYSPFAEDSAELPLLRFGHGVYQRGPTQQQSRPTGVPSADDEKEEEAPAGLVLAFIRSLVPQWVQALICSLYHGIRQLFTSIPVANEPHRRD